ncbi:MAG TPA: formaldehyde-activating enzyme [Acidimicrobiia bacterium]|nr:formaldehyde-activating enzyme [Acidimicrobiia bacterium]
MSPAFVSQVGEGFAGSGTTVAHVNTVLGARGGAFETAWVGALASPTVGHTPFVVVTRPGVAVKPTTLFVNKATITTDVHGRLTWGAAQAGVAAGVVQAVLAGHVARSAVDDLLLLAAVWVDPAVTTTDADAVFEHNVEATVGALRAGAERLPAWADVESSGDAPWNPYFRAEH